LETFDRFAVVVVPFPFTDRTATKRRPVLILSDAAAFNAPAGHAVMAMITSSGRDRWPLDVPLSDPASAGLAKPCLVRMKLFTLDLRLIVRQLGRLGAADAGAVEGSIEKLLGR